MRKAYSYKVCYREHGSKKLKRHIVTNSYDGAIWYVEYYTKHPPNGIQAEWVVIPVTSKLKHKWLWQRCPF